MTYTLVAHFWKKRTPSTTAAATRTINKQTCAAPENLSNKMWFKLLLSVYLSNVCEFLFGQKFYSPFLFIDSTIYICGVCIKDWKIAQIYMWVWVYILTSHDCILFKYVSAYTQDGFAVCMQKAINEASMLFPFLYARNINVKTTESRMRHRKVIVNLGSYLLYRQPYIKRNTRYLACMDVTFQRPIYPCRSNANLYHLFIFFFLTRSDTVCAAVFTHSKLSICVFKYLLYVCVFCSFFFWCDIFRFIQLELIFVFVSTAVTAAPKASSSAFFLLLVIFIRSTFPNTLVSKKSI